MKYPIVATVALSILAVNLQAQQPAASQQPASAHSTKVLSGCLRAGPAPETFVLTNATPKVDANDLAGPAVGTSGEKAEYDLVTDTGLDRSGPPVELKNHVGQQIEVTVRPADTTVAPPAPSSTKQSTAEAKPVERKPARVTVTALKSLSSSCS